jgi:hypothetical protein
MPPAANINLLMYITTAAVLLLQLNPSVSGYKSGPPVVDHVDICDSMSPREGHIVEPLRTPPPFDLRVVSTADNCYSHHRSLVVKLVSRPDERNKTWYFEGFFVQVRPAAATADRPFTLPSNDYNYGQFDTYNDRELQTLSCPGSANNSLGHREAHRYYNKTFTWTPSTSSKSNLQFVATVVHEKDEYWMNVTSPVLRYDVNCVYSAASSLLLLPLPAAAAAAVFSIVPSLLAFIYSHL